MENLVKLLYVVIGPVAIILFYDDVVVTNWALWTVQYPPLERVPRWAILASAATLYAWNIWILVGANWFRERHRGRAHNHKLDGKQKKQPGKVLQFPHD